MRMRGIIARLIVASLTVVMVVANCWATPDHNRVERIHKNIKQVIEEGKPFDIEGLINDIQNLPNELDKNTHSALTPSLALLLFPDGKMQYMPQSLTGRDPRDILRSTII